MYPPTPLHLLFLSPPPPFSPPLPPLPPLFPLLPIIPLKPPPSQVLPRYVMRDLTGTIGKHSFQIFTTLTQLVFMEICLRVT